MNIPETQKDLLAYLDRITRELGSTRGRRIQNRLDHFTTASITDSLAISRSLASQYLNELVRAGLVVKAGARPVLLPPLPRTLLPVALSVAPTLRSSSSSPRSETASDSTLTAQSVTS
ncbi:MAG: hypothetical protein ACLU37_04785 [Collinsella sp.]